MRLSTQHRSQSNQQCTQSEQPQIHGFRYRVNRPCNDPAAVIVGADTLHMRDRGPTVAIDHKGVPGEGTGKGQVIDGAVACLEPTLVSPAEAIRGFRVVPGPFVVGDELTPTQKVRRDYVLAKLCADVEALYDTGSTAASR